MLRKFAHTYNSELGRHVREPLSFLCIMTVLKSKCSCHHHPGTVMKHALTQHTCNVTSYKSHTFVFKRIAECQYRHSIEDLPVTSPQWSTYTYSHTHMLFSQHIYTVMLFCFGTQQFKRSSFPLDAKRQNESFALNFAVAERYVVFAMHFEIFRKLHVLVIRSLK